MGSQPQLIFVLGIFAALATLPALADIARKKLLLQLLFFLGIGAQITTQGIQFKNAEVTQKDIERAEAFAQYAYTEQDMVLLDDVARNRPYLIGYRFFRNGVEKNARQDYAGADADFVEAAKKFDESIGRKQFVAQIYYLKADMDWLKCKRDLAHCDFSAAKNNLGAAIHEDQRYSPPYYLRALIEVNSNSQDDALNDLQKAVDKEPQAGAEIVCFDLNNPTELPLWSGVSGTSQFQTMQKKCRETYPVMCKDPVIKCP